MRLPYVSEVDCQVDGEVGHEVPRVLVNDIRTALGLLADAAYDHPSGRVKVCAFTGTKGKTTSAYYLRSILSEHAREMGRPVPALLTGVEYDDGVERGDSAAHHARGPSNSSGGSPTPPAWAASTWSWRRRVEAIKFRRTLGVDFAVGAFTNFGEDHISPIEHPTLEDYLESKLLLFDAAAWPW
ncbi:MAG: Mur ligase family protein [Collinsella sp.]